MKIKKLSSVVIIKDQKILLLKRSDLGVWEIPGGNIEYGETPYNAAIREAKEETNLDIEIKDILTVLSISRKELDYQIIVTIYLANLKNDKIQIDDSHLDYQWLSLDEIKKLKNNKSEKFAFGMDELIDVLSKKLKN